MKSMERGHDRETKIRGPQTRHKYLPAQNTTIHQCHLLQKLSAFSGCLPQSLQDEYLAFSTDCWTGNGYTSGEDCVNNIAKPAITYANGLAALAVTGSRSHMGSLNIQNVRFNTHRLAILSPWLAYAHISIFYVQVSRSFSQY